MTATVTSLQGYRRPPAPASKCACSSDWTCYPHRLADLAARVDDLRTDVEQMQFVDMSTFRRLTADVLEVVAGINGECLPDEPSPRTERTAR